MRKLSTALLILFALALAGCEATSASWDFGATSRTQARADADKVTAQEDASARIHEANQDAAARMHEADQDAAARKEEARQSSVAEQVRAQQEALKQMYRSAANQRMVGYLALCSVAVVLIFMGIAFWAFVVHAIRDFLKHRLNIRWKMFDRMLEFQSERDRIMERDRQRLVDFLKREDVNVGTSDEMSEKDFGKLCQVATVWQGPDRDIFSGQKMGAVVIDGNPMLFKIKGELTGPVPEAPNFTLP